jgi:hypothetical protein
VKLAIILALLSLAAIGWVVVAVAIHRRVKRERSAFRESCEGKETEFKDRQRVLDELATRVSPAIH